MTTLLGRGLHTGAEASVRIVAEDGPVRLNGVPLVELVFDGAARSTAAQHPSWTVRTVEHLFAALGGLGIHRDVNVIVTGPELPLLDGGARAFADAVASFRPSRTRWVVACEATIDVGTSRYVFEPAPRVELEVEVDFDRLDTHARWSGDADDFRDRIAPARTFGFAHEVDELLARGLANHVTPESVVVIVREGVLSAGLPFSPDEPARHKLLDLIGDLYAHGGPPIGKIRAIRPGHAATHSAVARAIDNQVLIEVTRDEPFVD